jgi:hypothetical protein
LPADPAESLTFRPFGRVPSAYTLINSQVMLANSAKTLKIGHSTSGHSSEVAEKARSISSFVSDFAEKVTHES